MLDKDESHSGIGGKVLQESRKRLQPSGGSACRNDGERGHRRQILLFGVPCHGIAVILRTRCRLILSVRCIHRGPGRVAGIEGAPRRLFGFSHGSLHSCELKGSLHFVDTIDYASLGGIASIEVKRGQFVALFFYSAF